MRPYERFLNYVMFDTMSLEGQTTVPSTPGQRTLAEALVSELRGFGIEDVRLDDKGYIYGSVPSNIEKEVPVIGFIAHVDTSDAHPSPSKAPRIIENYDGSQIELAPGVLLDSANDSNLQNAIGADFGDIEYENFYGASLTVDIKGVSTHPGEAKDKMKNASLIAMEFDALLPPWERPEHTQDYEGFYHLMHISGDCGHCQMNYIIREHDYEKYQQRKTMALQGAEILNQRYGEGTVSAEVKDGYRNMAEMVRPHMHLIDFAKEAIAQCGVTPRVPAIRGGTDGSELSYKGVPCPNLGTGSFNHHSLTEVANIDHMDQCTEVILKIISRYAEFEA